jgi:hypothetical protein
LLGQATALLEDHRCEKAEQLFRRVLEGSLETSFELGSDHHITIAAFFGIAEAWILLSAERDDPDLARVALQVLRSVYARRLRLVGADHIDTLKTLRAIALASETQGYGFYRIYLT